MKNRIVFADSIFPLELFLCFSDADPVPWKSHMFQKYAEFWPKLWPTKRAFVCLSGTQRHGGIGSTPLLWHSSLLREKVVGSANSNSANSCKTLCFCGFMTQTCTQLRKEDNGHNTSKQGRRANAIGANTAQYGYKVPVVHSTRTFGSRMPQVRILSLGPPYEKNRQKWRFFCVYCVIFW